MAINTQPLSQLIAEFRAIQTKASVSPNSLGYILQQIADIVSSASTAQDIASVNSELRLLISNESWERGNAMRDLELIISQETMARISQDSKLSAALDTIKAAIGSANISHFGHVTTCENYEVTRISDEKLPRSTDNIIYDHQRQAFFAISENVAYRRWQGDGTHLTADGSPRYDVSFVDLTGAVWRHDAEGLVSGGKHANMLGVVSTGFTASPQALALAQEHDNKLRSGALINADNNTVYLSLDGSTSHSPDRYQGVGQWRHYVLELTGCLDCDRIIFWANSWNKGAAFDVAKGDFRREASSATFDVYTDWSRQENYDRFVAVQFVGVGEALYIETARLVEADAEAIRRKTADAALQESVDAVRTTLDAIVGKNASSAIDNFNEVLNFLRGVTDDEQLTGLLNGLNNRLSQLERSDFTHDQTEQNFEDRIAGVEYVSTRNASSIASIRNQLTAMTVTSVVPVQKTDGSLSLVIGYRNLNGSFPDNPQESFEIPLASRTSSGLLSKADYVRFDEAAQTAKASAVTLNQVSHVADITLESLSDGLNFNVAFAKGDGSRPDTYASSTLKVPVASEKRNGLMSAIDKSKLDNMDSRINDLSASQDFGKSGSACNYLNFDGFVNEEFVELLNLDDVLDSDEIKVYYCKGMMRFLAALSDSDDNNELLYFKHWKGEEDFNDSDYPRMGVIFQHRDALYYYNDADVLAKLPTHKELRRLKQCAKAFKHQPKFLQRGVIPIDAMPYVYYKNHGYIKLKTRNIFTSDGELITHFSGSTVPIKNAENREVKYEILPRISTGKGPALVGFVQPDADGKFDFDISLWANYIEQSGFDPSKFRLAIKQYYSPLGVYGAIVKINGEIKLASCMLMEAKVPGLPIKKIKETIWWGHERKFTVHDFIEEITGCTRVEIQVRTGRRLSKDKRLLYKENKRKFPKYRNVWRKCYATCTKHSASSFMTGRAKKGMGLIRVRVIHTKHSYSDWTYISFKVVGDNADYVAYEVI